jgi:hypothetical protein
LVDEAQIARGHRAPQCAFDREAALQVPVQLLREELELIAAMLFRVIHRGVGVAHQRGRIAAVFGIEADTDGGAQVVLVARHREGHGHGVHHAAREPRERLGAAVIGHEHHELVAAHARERVLRARACGKPLRNAAEQRVARIVARGVVDFLEAVQIDEDHRRVIGLGGLRRRGQ